jgi:hypothetical protein
MATRNQLLPLSPTLMRPPLMPADRPQYRLCPHPGELVRRVMSTHPASVNADDRVPRIFDGSTWRFAEMTQPHDWT